MRSLKIIVNNIELDHVREDAQIHNENSSFFDAIKVQHTTRPIRIIENAAAIAAMGEFTIATTKKTKYFPGEVVIGATRYAAVITQLESIRGFRKCNLKFGSEVNKIMDKKISSFFPAYSVINAEFPVAYTEEAIDQFNNQPDWVVQAAALDGKIFPEVMWQLPRMGYSYKFGTDLKAEDAHFYYRRYLNGRDLDGLETNSVISNASYFVMHNNNVLSPQVFFFAPLFYAFQSIGYKLQGNVVVSAFFKRLLLLSFNDNMVKISRKPPGVQLDIASPGWVQKEVYGLQNYPYQSYVKEVVFNPPNAGDYILRYDMTVLFANMNPLAYGVEIFQGGNLSAVRGGSAFPGRFEGKLFFTVEAGQENAPVTFVYYNFNKKMPEPGYEIGWLEDLPEQDFYDMHPTVDFSRYIPDWTVIDFLNKIQNQFNLKIDFDDIEKTISLNFNEEDYLIGGKSVTLTKSLEIADIKNVESESYVLKYENDIDATTFISLKAGAVRDENTTEIQTAFKFIPYGHLTCELSKDVEDKAGVGLMIYDPVNAPDISEHYMSKTLSIPGAGGIFETFHKPWLLFRLNSGNVVLKGPFSKTELHQISTYMKIIVDNQKWLVKAIDYKENAAALFDTELELESVTF